MNRVKMVGAIFLFVFLLGGCGGGGGSDAPDGLSDSENSEGNFHASGYANTPSDGLSGSSETSDVQHGLDFIANPRYCWACHGRDFRGGSAGVSCYECHHPDGSAYQHGEGVAGHKLPQDCDGCHGEGFEDDDGYTGRSCKDESCHADRRNCGYSPGCHQSLDSHPTHFLPNLKGPKLELSFGDRGSAEDDVCADCHLPTDPFNVTDFPDGVCDDCHSPGGAFDGVNDPSIGAFANWAGVYKADETLINGKENWCLTCHDDDPGTVDNESSLIQGVFAPNIAGDENNGDTYGFNITGHKINCLDCHVADKDHIDGEHRTYEVANDGQANQEVVNPYLDGYRLPDGSMRVPAPAGAAVIDVSDYGLCFECHNPDEVLGEDLDQDDVSQTNFWDSAPQVTAIGNAHNYHVRVGGLRGDTDWDGVVDARETCISCHTVHGSPTGMLRNGQLISTPGTTDKVPALNFSYTAIESIGPEATATFTSSALTNTASYNVYAWWTSASNRAEDATYTVSHDGVGSPDEVTVDQTVNGGQWNLLGSYSYNASSTGTVVLDNSFAIGQIVIADAIKWEEVGNPANSTIVDNVDATFVDDQNTWQTSTNQTPNPYGPDVRFISSHLQAVADPELTLVSSDGGWTQYGLGSIASNNICRACHGDGFAQYRRMPNLWPKVLTTLGVEPTAVSGDGTGTATITVTISDPDNNVNSVTIDLSSIGGGMAQAMGPKGDGIYSFTVNVPTGTLAADYSFEITATDLEGNTGTNSVILNVN